MPDIRNVSPLEHYKRVCSMLDFFCKRMDDTFRLFVQLSTAVVGGFIWLKMQPDAKSVAYLFPIARFVIPVLALLTVAQILTDFNNWYGYRKAESKLNPRAPAPNRLRSGRLEYLRVLLTVLVGIGAYCWLK